MRLFFEWAKNATPTYSISLNLRMANLNAVFGLKFLKALQIPSRQVYIGLGVFMSGKGNNNCAAAALPFLYRIGRA